MTLYRYDDVSFASMDENYIGPGRIEIVLSEYPVIKETPKGYWIGYCYKRWVSRTSKKRFAHPTKDQAWNSFRIRKQRQIEIYAARLARAQTALSLPQPL